MMPLRHWRLVFERSLQQVYEATGIPISRLSLMERGLSTPTASDIDRIATALELQGRVRDLFVLEVARSLNGYNANVQPLDTSAAVR